MIYDKTVMATQETNYAQLEGIRLEILEPWSHKQHRLLGNMTFAPTSMGYLRKLAIWNDNVEDLKYGVTTKRNPSLPDPDFSELWYNTPDEDLSE